MASGSSLRWLRTRRDRVDRDRLAAVEDVAFAVRELLDDVRDICGYDRTDVTAVYRDTLPLEHPARITLAQLTVALRRLGYDLVLSAVPRDGVPP